ncbi:MAG: serine/threonine-protein kinase [Turicibacter sp.]
MDTFEREYQLSLFDNLTSLNTSKKSEIILVQNSLNGKIYIKKILKSYNLDVYHKLTQISTKHIPKIYELFEEKDTLIMIEEFINGRTLEEIMAEDGILSDQQAITYILTLCDVLELLHEQQPPIIHRDIKPSNIMISNDNILKLIDFDVSRIYREDVELDTHILGTKGYASPEQFGFEQTDGRSDIYSIGILLNVLTKGTNIKTKKDMSVVEVVIDKCTKISADERYQSIQELKGALSNILNVFDEIPLVETKKLKVDWSNLILKEFKKIPGYSGKQPLTVIPFTIWYAFLLFGAFGMNAEENLLGVLQNIFLALTLLSITFLNANYKNIHKKLNVMQKSPVLGYLVYNFLLIMLGGFGLTLLGG